MLIKAGVDISRLERKTRRSLCKVERVWSRYGCELVITSTYEGNHKACSLHYANQAYDIRKCGVKTPQAVSEVRELLGEDFDIVIETDHVHIEYDP